MTSACSVAGGGEKSHAHLPEKTKEILESIREKLESAKNSAHTDSQSHSSGSHGEAGQDTLSGGHDTLVGGAHSEGHSDLGAISLPDLSHLHAAGAVVPATAHTGTDDCHTETHVAAVAPVEHVDLTLIGHAVEDLTKHLSKFST
jgi:hypothetical protein